MQCEESTIAVRVRGLEKTFGKGEARTMALKGIDLEISVGEFFMIVGPSGCGKTTLLSIIAGTLQGDTGEVTVFEFPLHQMKSGKVTEFRKQNIGFIFQQFNLIPTLTCLDNVIVPLLIQGESYSKAVLKGKAIMSEVGLETKFYEKPPVLSGGQQQRVAIARALVHDPRLIICDEPTSALDGETGAKITELLASVAKKSGRCVIVVTHDNRIYKYADRIGEMLDGKMMKVRGRG